MKVLYLECRMGASGDMLLGALSELVDQKAFVEEMNAAGLKGVTLTAVPDQKCGVSGTHMKVEIHHTEEISQDVHPHDSDIEHHEHHHHHDHMHMADIETMIQSLHVSDNVKKNALEVYQLIAGAESKVHGMPVTEVHFHEVGMMDAVADVVGTCLLMEKIGAERVYAGTVSVGSGMVKCAHGILPVPAPAAALLLEGIPCCQGWAEGELCTPTGAALLKHFVNSFEGMPAMTVEKIGCGTGTKDFAAANVLRAFAGEKEDHGEVVELSCNIDDQSAEEIGYAMNVLFASGALDVYTIPVQMKKNRPGIIFNCTCRENDAEKMTALMFKHLTTLGIRENVCRRHALKREIIEEETCFGKVHIKKAEGYGITKEKIEYDDLAAIAEREGCSIADVTAAIKKGRHE